MFRPHSLPFFGTKKRRPARSVKVRAGRRALPAPAGPAQKRWPKACSVLQKNADQAGTSLVDNALQRLLHFGAGGHGHVQKLCLQALVHQLAVSYTHLRTAPAKTSFSAL